MSGHQQRAQRLWLCSIHFCIALLRLWQPGACFTTWFSHCRPSPTIGRRILITFTEGERQDMCQALPGHRERARSRAIAAPLYLKSEGARAISLRARAHGGTAAAPAGVSAAARGATRRRGEPLRARGGRRASEECVRRTWPGRAGALPSARKVRRSRRARRKPVACDRMRSETTRKGRPIRRKPRRKCTCKGNRWHIGPSGRTPLPCTP